MNKGLVVQNGLGAVQAPSSVEGDAVGSDAERGFFRLQALAPGRYWKCRETGEVRLISRIKAVEGVAHTVELDAHPRSGARASKAAYLVDVFLSKFEFEPEGERVRAREIEALQAEITRIQDELGAISSNPSAIASLLPDAFSKAGLDTPTHLSLVADISSMMDAGIAEPGRIADSISTGSLTAKSLAEMQISAKRMSVIAEVRATAIEATAKKLSDTVSQLAPYFQERARVELAKTQDVRDRVATMMDGLKSLDLYIGDGVEVKQIRFGSRSPAGTPVHLFQAKRFVDEEVSVFTQFDDGIFDYSDADSFYQSLANTPALLDQVIPAQKGLALFGWRRTSRQYSGNDHFSNAAKNAENLRSWLLFRDGDSAWIIDSPVDTHESAARLFPSKTEMERVFQSWWGNEITWNDVRYADHVDQQNKLIAHYKRFAILLAGLQDREGLLGELPEKVDGGRLMLPEMQEKVFVFVRDDGDDGDGLIGDGRPDFREWLAQKNAYLRSGSRVAVFASACIDDETCPGAAKYSHSSSTGFVLTAKPVQKICIGVVFRREGTLCLDIPVRRLRGGGMREYFNASLDMTRVSKNYAEDFLCLDAVTVEELSYYIHSRRNRASYMHFISLFKAAKDRLLVEEQAMMPALVKLRAALDAGQIGLEADRDSLVGESVMMWRAANNGALLPDVGDAAFRGAEEALLDQMYALAGEGGVSSFFEQVAVLAESKDRVPLRLVVDGRGRFFLYTEPSDGELIKEGRAHRWVCRFRVERRKKGPVFSGSHKELNLPSVNSEERTLMEWPDAARWASMTGGVDAAQKRDLVAQSKNWEAGVEAVLSSNLNFSARMMEFKQRYCELVDKAPRSRYVMNVDVGIPVGFIEGEQKLFAVLLTFDEVAVLKKFADDKEVCALRRWFVERYSNKESAGERFDALDPDGLEIGLAEVSSKGIDRYTLYSFGRKGSNVVFTGRRGGFAVALLREPARMWCSVDLEKVPEALWLADGVEQWLSLGTA